MPAGGAVELSHLPEGVVWKGGMHEPASLIILLLVQYLTIMASALTRSSDLTYVLIIFVFHIASLLLTLRSQASCNSGSQILTMRTPHKCHALDPRHSTCAYVSRFERGWVA